MDWDEGYDRVVTACVSLVGSSILKKGPRELEQRTLRSKEEADKSQC